LGEFPRENVCSDQSQARTKSGERCRTIAGISDQRDSPMGVVLKMYLRHGFKTEIGCLFHTCEKMRNQPRFLVEPFMQQASLHSLVATIILNPPRTKAQSGLGFTIQSTRADGCNKSARRIVHEIPTVELNVCGDSEPCCVAIQRAQELRFGSESKATNRGMQTISANDEVKPARRSVLERHPETIVMVLKRGNRVVEHVLHVRSGCIVEYLAKISAKHFKLRDETLASAITSWGLCPYSTVCVDEAHAALVKCHIHHLSHKPHRLDHCPACAAQIHSLSAEAKLRCPLDHSRGE